VQWRTRRKEIREMKKVLFRSLALVAALALPTGVFAQAAGSAPAPTPAPTKSASTKSTKKHSKKKSTKPATTPAPTPSKMN
jgi:hypothetical protein